MSERLYDDLDDAYIEIGRLQKALDESRAESNRLAALAADGADVSTSLTLHLALKEGEVRELRNELQAIKSAQSKLDGESTGTPGQRARAVYFETLGIEPHEPWEALAPRRQEAWEAVARNE